MCCGGVSGLRFSSSAYITRSPPPHPLNGVKLQADPNDERSKGRCSRLTACLTFKQQVVKSKVTAIQDKDFWTMDPEEDPRSFRRKWRGRGCYPEKGVANELRRTDIIHPAQFVSRSRSERGASLVFLCHRLGRDAEGSTWRGAREPTTTEPPPPARWFAVSVGIAIEIPPLVFFISLEDIFLGFLAFAATVVSFYGATLRRGPSAFKNAQSILILRLGGSSKL